MRGVLGKKREVSPPEGREEEACVFPEEVRRRESVPHP